MKDSIIFDTELGTTKPENLRKKSDPCPFCQPDKLTHILAKEGPTIWLLNKYPVLQDCWQTVIVETDDCNGEFSRYNEDEATRILKFSLYHWQETIRSNKFKSVLYLKNFGPMSGGSLKHPHSQIIGLTNYDYKDDIQRRYFEGWTIATYEGIELTLSKHPISGFFEFNFIIGPTYQLSTLAKTMQKVLHYVLNGFSNYATSYNVFFYDLEDGFLYAKIVPRFLTSPLFVGYKISQVCKESRAQKVVKELQLLLP